MRQIENLVFKGGGVLGIAYAGCIQALEQAQLLDNIKGVAGTSAGSIISTVLALRYSPAEIKKIVASTNFKDFEDHWDPLRIPTKYGIYKGDYFLNWIKGLIKAKTGSENTTYAELASKGFRDLKVFATDLNAGCAKEFSNDKTPGVIVAESVRASMSIPLFFSAWKFPNNNPDDHIYVDGGTVYNYPINAFEDLSKTLGFFLHSSNPPKPNSLGYNHITMYIKSLFHTLMQAQNIEFEKNVQENKISVKVEDFGISATNFSITQEMEDKLYQSGLECTTSYINQNIS